MKTRIINGNEFGGVHQDIWLVNNQDIVFAGQLVSEWVLTDVLPSTDIKSPKWNGSEWIECISSEEIRIAKEEKAIQIDLEYTNMISLLMNKHVEKYIIDGTHIPLNIIEKRNELRQECNDKISDLGITNFTYRKRIIGL